MKKRFGTDKKTINQKGFALLESLVFIVSFMVLAVYTIDFFTIIHTGIVGSIGARTYLFETLQHRNDVRLLRGVGLPNQSDNPDFSAQHERFHAISDEDQGFNDNTQMAAVGRVLTRVDETIVGRVVDPRLDSNNNEASVVQIKSGYGICVDSGCRGDARQ